MKKGYSVSIDGVLAEYFSVDSRQNTENFDHCHDRYEITLVTSSTGKYIIEGSEHKICPGAIIFIQPLVYHKVVIDGNSDFEGYTIYFSEGAIPDAVAPLLKKINESVNNKGRYYSSGRYPDAVVSAFERFDTAEMLPEAERKAYLCALLSEIVILLSAAGGELMSQTDDELGARVVKYLNRNIDKNISLDRLARRFFVSKYHLCRAFKNYSGISVHSYINYKRIMYAKQLIESGESASGAAERVGFGDYSAFYRAYIKIVGKSPTKD